MEPLAEQNGQDYESTEAQDTLFVDNGSAHEFTRQMTHVRLEYFPPNTTTKLQQCDQGIIRSLKATYRRRLEKFMLAQTRTQKIDLYKALMMLRVSWEDVTVVTIQKSWKKSSIFVQNTQMESGEDPEDETINGGEIEDIEDTSSIFPPQEADLENLLNLVEEEEKLEDVNKDEDPEYDNIEEKEVKQVKSTLECLDYLKEIHNRFVTAGMEPPLGIANLEDKLRSLPKHQSYLTDFY